MFPSLSKLEERLAYARLRVLNDGIQTIGIGGLNEKVLHRILKLTVEPSEEKHEVSYLGSVVDILNEDGITEVQTRNLDKLRPKLSKLLGEERVRLIYPIPAVKYLRWINTETGEITSRRRVPKKSTVFDAYRELLRIRPLLANENLTVTLFLLELEEYRVLSNYGKTGKRGSVRFERIPEKILGVEHLSNPEDYKRAFLPTGLCDPFTVKEYATAIQQKTRWAYHGIRILMDVGVLYKVGERGREYLYSSSNIVE